MFDYSQFSRAGRGHENQDATLSVLVDEQEMWAAVADGVGGADGGSIASRTVVDAISGLLDRRSTLEMPVAFATAKRRLEALAMQDEALSRMATTLTVCRLSAGVCTVGHVGDTRLYHLRGNGFRTRTADQTEAQRLVDEGILRPADVRRYPRRNVLLSSLSPARDYDLFETKFNVVAGDRIILASDGVHGVLQRREIRDISFRSNSAQEFCNAIEQEVAQRGPVDDYSAVAIFIS